MFDAATRLAQGRPAADTVQDYVWACHLLGYQDPDLTLHASQVRDWYGSEDGIDLSALEADCEALRAAAAAAEGIVARQDAQLALMSHAWDGTGAQASRDFLRRHGEASAAAVSALRAAAESMASLRDRLWHSVDGKVAATIAAEGRGARPDWRVAAQTVTTGAGDRAAASELVDQEVKPFVASDIRSEWLTAMRSAIASVGAAYEEATSEITSEMPVAFDVPGDLGPTWAPPAAEVATEPAGVNSVAAAPVVPAAWSAPPATAPLSAPPASSPPLPPAPALPAAPPVDPAAMVPPPSMPAMGGGMPDMGSGLSGFGGQLGDMLGGLLPEPDELDALDEDKPDDLDPAEDEDDDEDESEDEEALPEDEEPEEPESPEADAEPKPVTDAAGELPLDEPPVEPAPTPVPAPPPIEPLAAPAAGTPCEIAADELPQVGE